MNQGISLERTKMLAGAPAVLGAYRQTESEHEALRVVLKLLRKRGWAIAICVALGVAAGLTITAKATRQYEAVSQISVAKEPNTNLKVSEDNDNGVAFDYNIELDTQVSIVRSGATALQVIKQLDLVHNPAFIGHKISSEHWSSTEEAALLGAWYSGLGVTRVPHTRIIEIKFTSPDPELAARIANALTDAYVERNFRAKYESTMQATDWLSRQLNDLELKVQLSQKALIEYQKQNGFIGLDDKQNITTDKLNDLNKDLTIAENERISKEATYQEAKNNPDSLPALAGNALFQHLRENETDLDRQAAQLEAQFGPSYPKVIEVNRQLRQTRSAVRVEIDRALAQSKQEFLAASNRERSLRDAFDNQKRAATSLREQSIRFTQLKQEADSNRALYDSLSQKLKEAKFTSTIRSSNISVIDKARPPSSPSQPNKRKNLLLGLMMGLVSGLGLALLLEALDRTVRTPEEVEEVAGLPSLGTIPLFAERNEEKQSKTLSVIGAPLSMTVALSRPKSNLAEAYRALRTSILLSSIGRAPQLILLTSALPQEGKTTTSVNTAIVLAQKGSRVLLIDADMRRPSIDRLFGLLGKRGLSSILAGEATAGDCIVPAPSIEGLSVLPSGPHPPNPAELLSSDLMSSYLEQWRREFDFIVIDSPPVLSVTDAVALSPLVDSVVLVMRSARTTKDALRRAVHLFQKVNVRPLGIVVNAVNWKSADAKYYGYSYGYADASSYYEDGEVVGTE